MLYQVLSFKGETKKVKNTIVDYRLNMIAHNLSGFVSFFVLNNLPQWRSVVKVIKNWAGIFSLKVFNGYVDPNYKNPQNLTFRCGKVRNSNSLTKKGISYILQTLGISSITN